MKKGDIGGFTFSGLEKGNLALEGAEVWVISIFDGAKLVPFDRPYYRSGPGNWSCQELFSFGGLNNSLMENLRDKWIGENVKWEKL